MKSLARAVLLTLAIVAQTAAISIHVDRADVGIVPREPLSDFDPGDHARTEVMAPRDVRLVRRLGKWQYNETGTS